MKRSATIPAQRPPAVQLTCKSIPRGDGSFVVIPGKPVSRLTPDQFGQMIGVSAMTARRWIHDETIPPEFVQRRSKTRWWIDTAAVDAVRTALNQKKTSTL